MNKHQIKALFITQAQEYHKFIERILSDEKSALFGIEWTNTLLTSLERLSKGGIDVVLIDLTTSSGQGLDVVSQIQTQNPEVPIVVLQSSTEDTLPPETIRKGIQDLLFKDQVDSKMLSRAIRYAIERKRMEIELERQAIRDTLTDLYNRRYLSIMIEQAIAQAGRSGSLFAVLLCDLDQFKAVNDILGHHVGDKVLKSVAKSIQQSTRGTDLVFRWGGDEIVVLLTNTSRDGLLIAAERIRKGIRQIARDISLELDLSIGIALYPEHGTNEDELLRVADQALYIAKKGGDKIHIGKDEYELDDHSIKVVFQPIVKVQPLVDNQSQEIIGYEALGRDPEGKLSILDLFKKYSAIGKLDELKCICFRVQLKAAQEIKLQRVFINVDFNVLCELEAIQKPQEMEVILEISEREALHDVEDHLRTAQKWRERGYKFAIDDFGAGFISLPFIARLIPDYIKVDRSTVLQAVTSETFRIVLKDLLASLGNCTKDGIIAEGIETEKELQVVKEIRINMVQGFLFGKPRELK